MGKDGLKGVFYFLATKRIKSTLDRGEGGVWVTPNFSEVGLCLPDSHLCD